MKQRNKQKISKRITAAAAVFVGLLSTTFLAAPPASAQTLSGSPVRQSTLQDYADQLHAAGVTGVLMDARPGMHTVKARSGEAVLGTGQPVPWGAHFKTGSTTKTFVSTVILQLEAEGKLSLDDSLQNWLPDVLGTNYDESTITIRHLLGQTSGIFDYTSDDAFLEAILTKEGFEANRFKNYTIQDLINFAKAHPPVFAPGTSWEYSNTNYILAGMVIKAATGNSWNKEVRDRILRPLHMNETTSAGSRAGLPQPFARAYHIFSTDPAARTYTDTTLHNMSWADSAGDLVTTTKDENRFFKALLKGQLLPPSQLAKMKTVTMLDENLGYGLGILWSNLPCDSRGFWSHGGGVVGYSTGNGVTDDGRRSAVLSLSTTSFSDDMYLNEVNQVGNDMMAYALCGDQSTEAAPQRGAGPANSGIKNVPANAVQQLRDRLR